MVVGVLPLECPALSAQGGYLSNIYRSAVHRHCWECVLCELLIASCELYGVYYYVVFVCIGMYGVSSLTDLV